MKNIISIKVFITALCIVTTMNAAQAQNDADPAVTSLSFAKSPIEVDEETTLTVFIVNNGFTTEVAAGSIGLRIALPLDAEYAAFPESVAAVSGPYSGYFNWTYNSGTKEFLGTSNQPILAGEGGTVVINIKGYVVVNDRLSSANIVTLDPSAYPNDNSTNNDLTITLSVEPGGTLPITLLSFNAVKQSNSVNLKWETSAENNSSHFEVQTSRNGTDWESIGTVQATGNSNTAQHYSLIHNSPAKGINYYRLKQFDTHGKFEYSLTRSVSFSTTATITVSPNPTADKVYITSSSTNAVKSVTVYSAAGKLMQHINNFILGGSIDMSRYADGIYLLKIIDKDGQTEVIRIVKSK